MIGWMIGRCHSTLSDAIRRADLTEEIEAADRILAAGYAEGEVIEGIATFKARCRHWRVA